MEAPGDSSQAATTSYVRKLEAAIGKENVNTSKFERLLYSHDLAPLPKEAQLAFNNIPDVVVRPRSTEDVQRIVRIAAEERIPITPRGSSSWGLGGSIPVFGGILIDMTGGMNKIVKIDIENLYVIVEAGATWKQVYEACLRKASSSARIRAVTQARPLQDGYLQEASGLATTSTVQQATTYGAWRL